MLLSIIAGVIIMVAGYLIGEYLKTVTIPVHILFMTVNVGLPNWMPLICKVLGVIVGLSVITVGLIRGAWKWLR